MVKVLLLEDIISLGWLGDIVDVKDGYARNYLVPCGLATIPSKENIEAIAEEKAKRANERKLEYEKLCKVAEEVEDASVVIEAKANEQGHLFGSVTPEMIAEKLRENGYEIADEMVAVGHIKEVGEHKVTLKISVDLDASVEVKVVSEGSIPLEEEKPEQPEQEEDELSEAKSETSEE
ncbi:50S ribosomal protein L9 [Sedimentisphaera salicampi]|uniref:Large ribosomal subunit protein bL9 n=1 Tax=Sedimentisphaera salicampi TaxID=1941349 RepID=A0A1W6LJ36_9BACT|nr:50S ribosomal protein L9 [Sedimentisphaera salicampi]ARN55753.1 50S ribosomal protein L9 [Sedimentisphaera salicampi]OXU15949.1 50S ribosomal protein L9 [Sedimentisphaera salicampi]